MFLGAATPVSVRSPANKKCFPTVPPFEHHVARAGSFCRHRLVDRTRRRPKTRAVLQPGSRCLRRRADGARTRCAVHRAQLNRSGCVDFVIWKGSLFSGSCRQSYDAVFFASAPRYGSGDQPGLLAECGSSHVWNLAQESPATEWERQIDAAMARNGTSLDDGERHRAFVEAQQIFAAHAPVLYFAAPRIYIAAASRVMNLSPAVLRPQLLWSADTIAVAH